MGVVWTAAMDSELALIAFSSNGTDNPDSFIVTNLEKEAKTIVVHAKGSGSRAFEAFRTSDEGERYRAIGSHQLKEDQILYDAPARSVTTFLAK
jgi:hypothetical protein